MDAIAEYERTLVVTFAAYGPPGNPVIERRTVPAGGSITSYPTPPVIPGYTFVGWILPLADLTDINCDMLVYAEYMANPVVVFMDWNGAELKTQTVAYGSAATAPTPPPRAGYVFTGWDMPFDNVISDLIVTAQYSGISISQTGSYNFPAATADYPAQAARSVTVNNIGDVPTGNLTVALSGANAGSFALSKTLINSIVVGANDVFIIVPLTGLSAGTYMATVTVSGANISSCAFNVAYTVNKASPTLTLSTSLTDTATHTSSITLTTALTSAAFGNMNKTVIFSVNGSEYYAVTDAEGIAEYTVTDLAADAFTLAASFAGDINNNNAAEMPVDCYNVTFADWNVTIPSAWRGSTAADQKNHRATKLKKKRYLLLHL